MVRKHPLLVEVLTAIALVAVPFVLPYLGFTPNTINRILIWGLFGLGFDILFGYTGLLSFGQSAFFGTGGMFAAYLLTETGFSYVMAAVVLGTIVAAVVGYLIGLIALRRTGIYFAMITVAIAEVFSFVEFIRCRRLPVARTACRACRSRASSSVSRRCASTPIPRSIGFSPSGTLSAWPLRFASCARRLARCCALSATTRCGRPLSATTFMATN
jgi:branched-subunit amino acid ABC-type transport system permease component